MIYWFTGQPAHGKTVLANMLKEKLPNAFRIDGDDVIVSLVAPYIDQREDFKALMDDEIIEFYVHTSEPRERDHFKAIAYVAPSKNFVDIDTTYDTPEQSFKKIKDAI